MKRATIELLRCVGCGKLVTDRHIQKWVYGKCKCGSNKIRGGSPSNLWEQILIRWWNQFLD